MLQITTLSISKVHFIFTSVKRDVYTKVLPQNKQTYEDAKRIFNSHTTGNQNNKVVTAEILIFLKALLQKA